MTTENQIIHYGTSKLLTGLMYGEASLFLHSLYKSFYKDNIISCETLENDIETAKFQEYLTLYISKTFKKRTKHCFQSYYNEYWFNWCLKENIKIYRKYATLIDIA